MNRLKNKILLVLITILLITIGTNNFLNGYFFNQEYSKAIERELFLIGGSLKQQLERILSLGINIEDIFLFEEICREVVEEYPEVSYALVFNKHGDLLFHSENEEIQKVHVDKSTFENALQNNEGALIDISIEGKELDAALVPVIDGNIVQGAVVIVVVDAYISQLTNKIIHYSVIQFVLFFTVSLILLVVFLSIWVTTPLNNIMKTMANAGSGNLNARVKLKSKDEFGMLGSKLNRMLDKIKELMASQEKAAQFQLEYVSERERSRISESLRQAMYNLNSTLDESKVQQLILDQLMEFVNYSNASIWIYEKNDLEKIVSCHKEENSYRAELEKQELDSIFLNLKVKEKQVLTFNKDDFNYMIIPFKLYSNVRGMVVLQRMEEFVQSDIDIALAYTSQANIAMDNAIIYRKMEMMAITDELTGVYNRRHFYTKAQEAFEYIHAGQEQTSIILFDIDYFKRINDQYGHPVGDEVLRTIPSILNKSISDDHILARFGGEEFVMLLPKVGRYEVSRIAEIIRKEMQNHVFKLNKESFNVTISVGVTEILKEDTMDTLLKRVDEALYEAKELGRNRVVLK
ncbi:diguanylate cyclase [Evansella sp. AB-P1]|uniref:diguanylate cyclase n=1 Tax=Evansella sp. AB-P1 TaxID=3037653 RepID=UPI00241DED69|nr:diguanylate cyclase [Evansella sp. AB-P1]MDG5790103.1 diguanylate cyclase [Evansella sp. AB-P1]